MYLPKQFQAFDKLMCNVYQYIFGCSVLFGYKIIHACNLWFSNIPAFFFKLSPARFLRFSEALGSRSNTKEIWKKRLG